MSKRFEECFYSASDGLQLFYRSFGTRNSQLPVLCLPGLTRNSRDFQALAAHLSPARRVICPDLRGRGFSEHDPNYLNYVPATYITDVVTLLDELDIARAIFIGTSLGGMVSMGMAATHPARVAAVVLNDVGPEIDPIGLKRIRGFAGNQAPVSNWSEAIAQAKSTHGATAPGLSDSQWLGFAKNIYREDAKGFPQLDMDPKIGDAMRQAPPTAADPWTLWPAMRGIPALVLRGETSDILSTSTVKRMRLEKPDLITVTVPDRGHAPLLDEPVALRAIDQFLAELP